MFLFIFYFHSWISIHFLFDNLLNQIDYLSANEVFISILHIRIILCKYIGIYSPKISKYLSSYENLHFRRRVSNWYEILFYFILTLKFHILNNSCKEISKFRREVLGQGEPLSSNSLPKSPRLNIGNFKNTLNEYHFFVPTFCFCLTSYLYFCVLPICLPACLSPSSSSSSFTTGRGLLQGGLAFIGLGILQNGGLPLPFSSASNSKYQIKGDSSIMSQKSHGTSSMPVQSNLRLIHIHFS